MRAEDGKRESDMGAGLRGNWKQAADGAAAKWKTAFENLFVVVLAFYPFRHVSWGLDLWDTGYNYANFKYMGLEHMDPMWLFSTYLANAAGSFLSGLPNGETLIGMNIYTSLFAGLLAVAGYFFCGKVLRMPSWIAFLGEFTALSLCWCPTAVLYNYITYVLFLAGVILLYCGLAEEKKGCLIGAGACLGLNVFVRFSNLPEMGLIVAVWAYDVILWLEEKSTDKKRTGFWKRLLSHTGWCLSGYLGALAVMIVWIQLRYGMGNYVAGISRLFGMTDTATDYKAASMVKEMLKVYVENMYWAVRIGVIVTGGLVMFAVAGAMERGLVKREFRQTGRALRIGVRVLWAAVSCAMLGWLYYRGFCSMEFYNYGAMLRPGVLFLMLTMLIAAVRIFHPNSPKEEKLISGMLILVIFLTALGSNNKVYPSLNNLFVAAPYTLWQSWRFLTGAGRAELGKRPDKGLILDSFPVKGILAAFLAMCLFQFGCFGAGFAFAEGTGVQEVSAVVENNPVLRGMKMSPERAKWMTEITAYANENGFQGREVILYGGIPSLSYYLQMPSSFNPWSDLTSYGVGTMRDALSKLSDEIAGEKKEAPVIIMEKDYVRYMEGGLTALKDAGVSEGIRIKITDGRNADKFPLLLDFMEEWSYQKVFDNGKFVIYDIL